MKISQNVSLDIDYTNIVTEVCKLRLLRCVNHLGLDKFVYQVALQPKFK